MYDMTTINKSDKVVGSDSGLLFSRRSRMCDASPLILVKSPRASLYLRFRALGSTR